MISRKDAHTDQHMLSINTLMRSGSAETGMTATGLKQIPVK